MTPYKLIVKFEAERDWENAPMPDHAVMAEAMRSVFLGLLRMGDVYVSSFDIIRLPTKEEYRSYRS